MQFLFIISHDADFAPTDTLIGDIFAWIEQATADGQRISGKPLQPPGTARTVRIRNGKRLLTDGPFSASDEQICAYELVECSSMEDALELAARHPMAAAATIEVRPVWTEREAE